jgi:hypothetical protein
MFIFEHDAKVVLEAFGTAVPQGCWVGAGGIADVWSAEPISPGALPARVADVEGEDIAVQDEDVFGLDVSVDDVEAVQVVEGASNLREDGLGVLLAEALAG